MWIAHWAGEIERIEQRRLVDEREQRRRPSPAEGEMSGCRTGCARQTVILARWENAERVVVVVEAKRDLLDVTLALSTPRRFACPLDGRYEEGDQYCDDRHDDEQFYERKSELGVTPSPHRCAPLVTAPELRLYIRLATAPPSATGRRPRLKSSASLYLMGCEHARSVRCLIVDIPPSEITEVVGRPQVNSSNILGFGIPEAPVQ